MVKEIRSIAINAKRMSWSMRGGITYNDIMWMSHDDIEEIHKVIDENMEATKKTKLPFI